ncbi:MAG: thiosulfate oxidation carrier protein SoxY [Pseudomonadota bacterium]
MDQPVKPSRPTRRTLLIATAATTAFGWLARPALAAPGELAKAQAALFGDREIRKGRVDVTLPPISENGYSVPIRIDVDSPMTETDHVVQVAVFSPQNPLPNVAQFKLGPRAGQASIETRIRLGGSQAVTVVAEMNDGSLWSGSDETVVTLAACVVL